ncbi:MAG: hypothetical protein WCS97_02300 [Candidatus Paceibacterota bacterium]
MLVEILSRLLNYFLHPDHVWMFGNEVHRAMDEFSGDTGPISEDAYEYFLDWFLFNFHYQGSETPLSYTHRTNPLNFSLEDLEGLKSILEHNRFGYFEVKATNHGRMMLMAIDDSKQYEIADTAGVLDVAAGDVFICRIAPIKGEWRVLNSSVLALQPTVRDWEIIRSRHIRDSREVYNEVIHGNVEPADLSVSEIEENLTLISEWLHEGSSKEDDDCPVCRVMRKAKEEHRQPSHEELTNAFQANTASNKKRHMF